MRVEVIHTAALRRNEMKVNLKNVDKVNATIFEECTDQCITRLVWFPKSQIKNDQAPGWLFLAKVNDLLEQVRMPAGGAYTVTISGMDF